MAEVRVIFPESGGVFVTDESIAVIAGNAVIWRFYVGNSDITQVKIEFEDPDCFPTIRQEPQWFDRNRSLVRDLRDVDVVPPSTQSGARYLKLNRRTWLGCTAPPLHPDEEYRSCRYTVRGLNEKGKTKEKFDPEIIVDRPKRP